MAAANVTITKKSVTGDQRRHYGTLNLGVYATGGSTYTASSFGLSKLAQLRLQSCGVLAGVPKIISIDTSGLKLQGWVPSTAAEIANTTDLTAMVVWWEAVGT